MARAGLAASLGREWRRLRADSWDWAMLTWIPLLLCALTWWIFSAGVPRELPLAVVDADRSALSRQLTRMLDAAPALAVAGVAPDEATALSWLRERRVYGIVHIPEGFARDVQQGGTSPVQWAYNGQFTTHAGVMGRAVQQVVGTLSAGVELVAREKRGAAPQVAAAQREPVRGRPETLFNPEASYEAFLALGVIPALLHILITTAAVVAIGRELKAGTVPDWLAAADGRWGVALLGKLAWPALCFMPIWLLYLGFFAGVRGWAIEGSAAMLVLGAALLTLACLGLGALLVALTRNLRVALSMAGFITAPAFAFSGQSFPLQSMPAAARAWAEALPVTHYLQLQSKHWLAGAPARYGLPDAGVLAAYALVTLALAWLLLARRANTPAAWGRD